MGTSTGLERAATPKITVTPLGCMDYANTAFLLCFFWTDVGWATLENDEGRSEVAGDPALFERRPRLQQHDRPRLSNQIMPNIQTGANANSHFYGEYNDYGVQNIIQITNPGTLAQTPHRYPTTSHQSIATSSHPKYIYVPPRPLSQQFTGQEVYLNKLRTHFGPTTGQPSQRRFLLHGKGGVGKTQLALKYAEENANRYVDSVSKSILWNH